MRLCAEGLCGWCSEPVLRGEARFTGRELFHASCMEEYLMRAVGVRRLAEMMEYTFRREGDESHEGGI